MVPFLKGVLGQMLPMLGMAKQDNIRWVFSAGTWQLATQDPNTFYVLNSVTHNTCFLGCSLSALSKFSEAILDYVANIEKAPDPAVRKEAFAGEIDSAYDVIFNVWLQSREPKVLLIMYCNLFGAAV